MLEKGNDLCVWIHDKMIYENIFLAEIAEMLFDVNKFNCGNHGYFYNVLTENAENIFPAEIGEMLCDVNKFTCGNSRYISAFSGGNCGNVI